MTTSARRRAFVAVLAFVVGLSAGVPPLSGQAVPSLDARLTAMREAGKLPAIAGAVFSSERILAEAAFGVRRLGSDVAVTTGDLWHIGSITKSFTATLAAKFVERGELSWSTTLGEALSAQRAGAFSGVTVEHLLSHRAGLAPAAQSAMLSISRANLTLPEQRQTAVSAALKTLPADSLIRRRGQCFRNSRHSRSRAIWWTWRSA